MKIKVIGSGCPTCIKLHQWVVKLKEEGKINAEVEYSKDINELIELGVLNEDIIIQDSPKDTIEEAIEVEKIVKDEPFILVTSASHMTRAMIIFKKHNLNVIPIPTAFEVEDLSSEDYLSVKELKKTQLAIHEYIGIAWLKIKNFIN